MIFSGMSAVKKTQLKRKKLKCLFPLNEAKITHCTQTETKLQNYKKLLNGYFSTIKFTNVLFIKTKYVLFSTNTLKTHKKCQASDEMKESRVITWIFHADKKETQNKTKPKYKTKLNCKRIPPKGYYYN